MLYYSNDSHFSFIWSLHYTGNHTEELEQRGNVEQCGSSGECLEKKDWLVSLQRIGQRT